MSRSFLDRLIVLEGRTVDVAQLRTCLLPLVVSSEAMSDHFFGPCWSTSCRSLSSSCRRAQGRRQRTRQSLAVFPVAVARRIYGKPLRMHTLVPGETRWMSQAWLRPLRCVSGTSYV